MDHHSVVGGLATIACVAATALPAATDAHWIETTNLAPTNATGQSGRSLDANDAWFIIGAPFKGLDPFDPQGPGEASLFRRAGDALPVERSIDCPDPVDGDLFGTQVALTTPHGLSADRPIALVTAPRRTSPDGDILSGALYSFHPQSGDQFAHSQTVTPPDASLGQMFGTSMSVDGTTIAIGAPRDSTLDFVCGCVYVYEIDADGVLQLEGRIDPRHPSSEQFFGFSVSVDGDRLAVGSFADSSFAPIAGSVAIFERSDGNWTQTQRLIPDDLAPADFFGTAVALRDDTLVVSSNNRTVNGLLSVGRIYVFKSVGGTWMHHQTIDSPLPQEALYWGASLALEDDALVVGANHWEDDGERVGAAGVYVSGGDGMFQLAQVIRAEEASEGSGFGIASAITSGDIIIGAPQHGDPDGGSLHQFTRTCAGDLNGDGEATIADTMVLLGHWSTPGISPADLDNDFEVGISDLLIVSGYWGPCP